MDSEIICYGGTSCLAITSDFSLRKVRVQIAVSFSYRHIAVVGNAIPGTPDSSIGRFHLPP